MTNDTACSVPSIVSHLPPETGELGGSSLEGDRRACPGEEGEGTGLVFPEQETYWGQTGILLKTAMLSRKRNRSLLKDNWVYLFGFSPKTLSRKYT